ncbi:hypothetical protein [Flavobacterium sp.]|uniref:hypothetical protein n=4 Tax=Flavobacterium sp. TaxID=239 RepID=UPI004047AA4B
MKYFLFVFLIISSTVFGQYSMKYVKAKVTLKRGEVLNSNARIWDNLELKGDDKKKSKVAFLDIDNVVFYNMNKKTKSYDTLQVFPVKVSDKEIKMSFKLYESNKIIIYGSIVPGGGGGSFNGGALSAGNFATFNYSSSNAVDEYYCYFLENGKVSTMYLSHSLKSFAKMASDCFSFCKSLSDKINNKIYTKGNIKEIGDFYTNSCN